MKFRIAISLAVVLLGAGSIFAQSGELPSFSPAGSVADSPVPEGLPPLWTTPEGKGNFWVFGDYLFAFERGANLPPLVTTSPAGTPSGAAGLLGSTGTSTLFGGDRVNSDIRSGFRLGGGFWFDGEPKLGLEAGFMYIGNQSTSFAASSNGSVILARPFTNANTGAPDAFLAAFPGLASGSVSAQAGSGAFYETHLDIVEKSLDCGWFRLNSLIGYRFYSYTESLGIQQSLTPTGGGGVFLPGQQSQFNDMIGTHNTFNGLDMGFRPQFILSNSFSVELLGKVALGNLNEVVNVSGNSTSSATGVATSTTNTGFLALPGNSGAYHDNHWYALPEGGISLDWKIRPNLELRVGYSILVLQGVARAGDQIDTTLNPNQLPFGTMSGGANRPTFNLTRSDMWIQTINIGVAFTY